MAAMLTVPSVCKQTRQAPPTRTNYRSFFLEAARVERPAQQSSLLTCPSFPIDVVTGAARLTS
jgi:hypothetical protein